MNELRTVTINQTDISVKEYQGKRVVTFKDIDTCHNRPDGTARRNFSHNRQHFIEGVDFFITYQPDEIRTLGITRPQGGVPQRVTLITESGYLMLVKSFTDDLAWDIQRQLVNTYFRVESKTVDNTLKLQIQQERSKAMLLNANYRMLKFLMANKDNKPVMAMAKSLGIEIPEETPTPTVKDYSATEIGNAFGITATKVGRIANDNNLKTDEYGSWYKGKSRYSSKEVQTFRYNEKGKAKIKEILDSLTK